MKTSHVNARSANSNAPHQETRRLLALLLRLAIGYFLCGLYFSVSAQTSSRSIRIWLIPFENAGPNDVALGERVSEEIDLLRQSLERTGVRLLNVEDPLAMKARTWNPQFNVPNFQVVATQKKTLQTLQEFSRRHGVEVVVRFVTWDEAFGLLRAARTEGPDALPDVAQIGSTWAGFMAGAGLIQSRPERESMRGNWRDVLRVPAGRLPFANDVRLLFYWKRRPSDPPGSNELHINNSDWHAVMESFRNGTKQGDTLVVPTGITLNLLHDFLPLVWAGTGGSLVENNLLGQKIDLASDKALTIPNYLAGLTHLPLANGESRRLISFPESSHEEASRTFVNGGYRATIEPADFIGRWFQDFEERQDVSVKEGKPRRHFWDYAAAVVPPMNFKGGSDLVILKRSKVPDLAAELADFLATDPGYTGVLAESGHLPTGKPGYGVKELTESFAREGDETSARLFSEAVQKAIDQGIEYPDLEQWPLVVENHEVLERLQVVWRRMSEGDTPGMTDAAKDVQQYINSRTYLPARVWDLLGRMWLILLIVLAATGAVTARIHSLSLRRLIILLHIYRASRHESAKILGDNLKGLHESARTGTLSCGDLINKLGALADHYVKDPDGLAAYMALLGSDLLRELQRRRASSDIHSVVMRAFHGSQLYFTAWNHMDECVVKLQAPEPEQWRLSRYPAIATVILQEWLFNCTKEIACGARPVVSVTARRGVLEIESSGQLSNEQIATLKGRPSKGLLDVDAHGLILIRDISYYAFGGRVDVSQSADIIYLRIPLPLKSVKG